jgi:hypothetical protein
MIVVEKTWGRSMVHGQVFDNKSDDGELVAAYYEDGPRFFLLSSIFSEVHAREQPFSPDVEQPPSAVESRSGEGSWSPFLAQSMGGRTSGSIW